MVCTWPVAMQINKNTCPKTNTKTQFSHSNTFYQYINDNLEYSQAMYNLNKINLQLKSCQSLHPTQGCQQTVQCCQFHVWLRPSADNSIISIFIICYMKSIKAESSASRLSDPFLEGSTWDRLCRSSMTPPHAVPTVNHN